MAPSKVHLLGMNLEDLSAFAVRIGEPAYRGGQLFDWLYGKGVTDFRSMTNLGKEFRSRLELGASIGGLVPVNRQVSLRDGTIKFLFRLPNDLKIETVLIPPSSAVRPSGADEEEEQQRLTLCVSTQVGCPLDCTFCATGTMGFFRNLTTGEIVDQVLQVRRAVGKKITNVVFMGMGEPMLNYDNVMQAAEIMTTGMGIAARRITVSTAGWAEGIRRMGEEKRRLKLAVSLHSALDETRSSLMPVNDRFNLDALTTALEFYYRSTKQRVTFEVIFFDGINDSGREVSHIIKCARRVPSKINIIPYHPIASAGPEGVATSLRPSPRMEAIVERLRAAHLTVMVRSSAGEEINAACGQLAVQIERSATNRSNSPRPKLQTM